MHFYYAKALSDSLLTFQERTADKLFHSYKEIVFLAALNEQILAVDKVV